MSAIHESATITRADRTTSVELPETMRAMVLDEFGGDFRLERRRVPAPGRGEVLIRVLATGAGVTNELARNEGSRRSQRAQWTVAPGAPGATAGLSLAGTF